MHQRGHRRVAVVEGVVRAPECIGREVLRRALGCRVEGDAVVRVVARLQIVVIDPEAVVRILVEREAELVEIAARALCEMQIRRVRKWDTEPAELEAMLPGSVDYSWADHIDEARAVLAAIRAAKDAAP